MGLGKRKADEYDPAPLASSSTGLTSPAKRQKNDPSAEKRLARFKASCPKNIMERVDRVMTQRFFMIERNRSQGELREEFKVLGSTGNVYTVIIDKLPSCNCPDASKGNHCKHILFIFLKVLSVSMASMFYYQKALLSTELEAVFANAPAAPNSLSHARIQAAYAKAMGRLDESAELESVADKGDEGKMRIPEEGDNCPICYESMHDVDIKTLSFCDVCNNALHTECFQQWARTARPLTCVWCRAKWAVPQNDAGSSAGACVGTSEGYLNLGAVAGVSPVRDTSSYYNGPRRGQKGRGNFYRRSYY
ncbi:hypothetical protein JB92DRAFT_2795532 [Gautieria morchelliformis]|nr:hypothetical protein JB92DRAFT_2795532 [Gautieria morchelliformis]